MQKRGGPIPIRTNGRRKKNQRSRPFALEPKEEEVGERGPSQGKLAAVLVLSKMKGVRKTRGGPVRQLGGETTGVKEGGSRGFPSSLTDLYHQISGLEERGLARAKAS